MKEIEFYKYQGTGNDFIMIDNRELVFDSSDLNLVSNMCDRRFGIGADGLILIEKDNHTDFKMVYYNSDGSQSFCGNGARCTVRFAHYLGVFEEKVTFEAIDGIHRADYLGDDIVNLKMNDVNSIEKIEKDYFINTGSPHFIIYKDDIKSIDIITEAHRIRYNERFKEIGTNVNFVSENDNLISIRTYERGVEDETLSCGTGVTAVALSIADRRNELKGEYCINVEGGALTVSFQKNKNSYKDLWLKGKAEFVYQGIIKI